MLVGDEVGKTNWARVRRAVNIVLRSLSFSVVVEKVVVMSGFAID